MSARSSLRLSADLLLGGFIFNAVVTAAFHPSGSEDDHEAIFAEYADSGAWEAVHLGQLLGVLTALAGLLVLYRVLRANDDGGPLAGVAAAATVATATAFAVLQAIDGVALKQAVDAWVDASGAQEPIRFADAEVVRWLEWGAQSYFRVLLGLSLALFGTAIIAGRLLANWVGWSAVGAGLVSIAAGIDVGYSGLESSFQEVVGMVFLIAVLAFAIGIAGAARRAEPESARPD